VRLPDMHLPLPLTPGDAIGLFSPAGPVRDLEPVRRGIRILQEMGFVPRPGPLLTKQMNGCAPDPDCPDYLAGSDQERAHELHTLWRDPALRGLMAVRGGYGCLRLLPLLDYTLFRQNPRPVIGFSDLSGLASALLRRSGLAMIHGPVLTSLARHDQASRDRLRQLLCQGPFSLDWRGQVMIHQDGEAAGPLVCGNLTTLVHLLHTPWFPDLDGALLLIEDTGESPYRLDRLLTHLALTGCLENLAGIMLGEFDHAGLRERHPGRSLTRLVAQRVRELTRDRNIPCWSSVPVGHQRCNQALIFGHRYRMSDAGLLLYEEGS